MYKKFILYQQRIKILWQTTYFPPYNFGLGLSLMLAGWFIILSVLLFWGLDYGGLLAGHSPEEQTVLDITANFPNILENFIYWPYYLLVYLLRFLADDGILVIRMLNGIFMLIASGSLLFLLRKLNLSLRLSLLVASLFVCNSWILQLARLGTPHIQILTSILLFLVLMSLFRSGIRNRWIKIGLLAVAFWNWFNPLMVWGLGFIAAKLYCNRKSLKRYFGIKFIASLIVLAAILFILLIASWNTNLDNLFLSLGLPDQLPNINNVLNNFWQSLKAIVWQAPHYPQWWLAQLPVLGVFTASMLPFGAYTLLTKKILLPYKALMLCFGILLIFLSLNQGIQTQGSILFLLFIILLTALGINQFNNHWRQYFPFNPLARYIGITILSALICLSLFYQLQRYYIAWSHNPQTREIYHLKPTAD